MLFNVEGDSMALHWISLTVKYDSSTHDVLGVVVGNFMSLFYVDDGMIGSGDPEWLQGAINILIAIFRRVGLMANLE